MNNKKKAKQLKSTVAASAARACYVLDNLSELDMKLLYNCLKLFHGDFPKVYNGCEIWQTEVERLMERFPEDIKF